MLIINSPLIVCFTPDDDLNKIKTCSVKNSTETDVWMDLETLLNYSHHTTGCLTKEKRWKM
jgi:hypothetical protein